jgi:hypothetical protein
MNQLIGYWKDRREAVFLFMLLKLSPQQQQKTLKQLSRSHFLQFEMSLKKAHKCCTEL